MELDRLKKSVFQKLLNHGGEMCRNDQVGGKPRIGLVTLFSTKRAGSTMHAWAGYTHPQPKKIVYGCGEKIRAGCGPKRESGLTCGPIRRAVGPTLCKANLESQSGFMIILRIPTVK